MKIRGKAPKAFRSFEKEAPESCAFEGLRQFHLQFLETPCLLSWSLQLPALLGLSAPWEGRPGRERTGQGRAGVLEGTSTLEQELLSPHRGGPAFFHLSSRSYSQPLLRILHPHIALHVSFGVQLSFSVIPVSSFHCSSST